MANTTTNLPQVCTDDEFPNMYKNSTKSASETDAEISARIQALPQELRDIVLSFTDCFHIPTTVALNEPDYPYHKIHRPPVGLQLNRKLRAKFEKAYYSTVIFKWSTYCFTVLHDLEKWCDSLSSAQKEMLTCFRITTHFYGKGLHELHPDWILQDVADVRSWLGIPREVKLVLGTERSGEGDDIVDHEMYDEKGTRLPEGWPLA